MLSVIVILLHGNENLHFGVLFLVKVGEGVGGGRWLRIWCNFNANKRAKKKEP